MSKLYSILAIATLLCSVAFAEDEAPGLAVGKTAPPLDGAVWVTADGKAPDLKAKVLLLDFWHSG